MQAFSCAGCLSYERISHEKNDKRAFLSWADKVIANSKATADTFLAYRNDPKKLDVIYNGVDIAEYTCADNDEAGSFRKRLGIADDSFLVGAVGRIFPDKGFHVAIEAINKVRRIYKDVRLVIIGRTEKGIHSKYQKDDKYIAELEKIISSLGVQKHVIFAGYQEDMIPAYKAMDLLVFPTFTESFGRVLIEAMAAKKPVVASEVGGIPEIVEDGVSGFLVPTNDASSLAEKIILILNNQVMARQMGTAGHKRVKDIFSIEKNINRTEYVYEKTLTQSFKSKKKEIYS